MPLGGKGPWVILGIGIAGLIGLAVLASAMTRDPRTQRMMALRGRLEERFGIERVKVIPKASEYVLEVTVDATGFERPAGDGMPTRYADLVWVFQECYADVSPYRWVSVHFVTGEKDAAPIHEYRHDQNAFDTRVEKEVKEMLGARCRIQSSKDRSLRVENAGEIGAEQAQAAAQRLVHYRRGGWKRIEVQAAGARHVFGGDGTRLPE